MIADLPLMKNLHTALAKSSLIPFRLTAAMLATDVTIQKTFFFRSSSTLIIWSKTIEDTMKIVKSLDKSGLLIEDISETIKNEAK